MVLKEQKILRALTIAFTLVVVLAGFIALPGKVYAASNPGEKGKERVEKSQKSPTKPANEAQPAIALTFDDGPNPPYTDQILATLQHYNVPATFFVTGIQAQKFPGLVWQEHRMGHVVGNHTWSHPQLPHLSPERVRWEIDQTSQAITRATGVRPTLMRPPYGETNAMVRQQEAQANLTEALWNVDPDDWSMPGPDTIVKKVVTAAQHGSIVLMHDGGGDRSQTVAALPFIIETLQQRGFRFVTIPQLYAGSSPTIVP